MAQVLPQDRLVRKEVALGVIREIPPPMNHIGLSQIAPFLDVQSDDVIFSYITPEIDGLAPARAEDAESELAQHDDTFGTGRASIIDWAQKDHYDPSDVSRYRDFLRLAELAGGSAGSFPLTAGIMTEDFASKVARDTARRVRKLQNRAEWLILSLLQDNTVSYNDGKIKFTVTGTRPSGQTAQAPHSTVNWDTGTAHDPIGDLIYVQDYMYDTYFSHIDHGYISRKALRTIIASDKFAARAGVAGVYTGSGVSRPDPRYVLANWDYMAALQVVEAATGIKLELYDSVYRTRAIGSTTTVNTRFTDEKQIILLPSADDISTIDDTQIGFAKTLTSPHPEGNWTSGMYEWEEEDMDPWGRNVGTGIKMFPVFPHLEYTYTLKVLT